MALDPVILDDLEWKGMSDAVRSRIPAASDGLWTLHAPVDPGVTLLELFAWQLEQRLYRMDQIPEQTNLGLLTLLATSVRRTRCARTVLQLSAAGAALVKRGAAFTLDGATPALTYSTRATTSLLALRDNGLRLWSGGRERSADLAQGRAFILLAADGGASEARLELTLDQAPVPGTWIALYLGLRTSSAIAPQWSPAAVADVAPPAKVDWLYQANGGAWKTFVLDDGTGGLRRSGVVRLRVPTDWQAGSGDVYKVAIRTARSTFTAPPRLMALAVNAVVARHAHAVAPDPLPTLAWLPLPGNTIRLDRLGADLPILDAACVLWLREQKAGWRQWWPVRSLHTSGPARRAFVVDRAMAQLRFGDGTNGRLPVLADDGASNLYLRYAAGGGTAGAVGPSAVTTSSANWEGEDNVRARNLTESLGGAEAETLEEARQRSAAQLLVVTRAITRADFETVALATPGVALRRAHAAIGYHPAHPCQLVAGAVTVFLVPDAPRETVDPDLVEDAFVAAPMPDPGLVSMVTARLDAARLVTTELYVRAPRYHAVRLRAQLRGDVGDAAGLRALAEARLRDFLDPLIGGDDGDGWPFGEPVRASVMLRELQAAVGKQVQVAQVTMVLDGAEPGESCSALVIGPHDLVWLERLELQLDRSVAPAGGLR